MFPQNAGYSTDDGGEGEQGLGIHSPNQSMRQPVHQSGAASAYGAGQVVAPPQPLPAQLWQRANAMPLQHHQQQQYQGIGAPIGGGASAGGSGSLLGSLQQQHGGGTQQHFPQQYQQHGLGQLHTTDSLLAAAAMQQQDQQQQQQQTSTSSLLNEFYQQQQQRIPNTMGLHAASVSAGSSAQALQSMLGQQHMLLHQQQQQQQQQQFNLQSPQQSQLQGMGGGSSWLNQQAGSGNVLGLSEWQNAGGNRLASLQGLGGNQQLQGMGGSDAFSSMASMMSSGDASGMLSNQAYSSLLQQSHTQTPDLMGRLQLQLEQQQQLQLQQQLLSQQHQELQGQARRSSSMSSSSLIGQANNPALWQQQQQHRQQQQQQSHQQQYQQDQPPPSSMPPGMQSFFQSQLQSSVIPSESDEVVKRKIGKKRAKTFPEKLMQAMMDHEDEEAVGWLPDGKSFVIVSPDRFVQDILNKVFKQAKYASFIRKLHRWGFMRLTSGTGTDCFHHPLFQKNRKDLASKITCSTKDKPQAAMLLQHGGKGASGMRGMGFPADAKPPSLAGVEKFIRAKAAASAAAAATRLPEPSTAGQPEGGGVVPKAPPQSQAPAPSPGSSLHQSLSAVPQHSEEKDDNDSVEGAYVDGESVEEV